MSAVFQLGEECSAYTVCIVNRVLDDAQSIDPDIPEADVSGHIYGFSQNPGKLGYGNAVKERAHVLSNCVVLTSRMRQLEGEHAGASRCMSCAVANNFSREVDPNLTTREPVTIRKLYAYSTRRTLANQVEAGFYLAVNVKQGADLEACQEQPTELAPIPGCCLKLNSVKGSPVCKKSERGEVRPVCKQVLTLSTVTRRYWCFRHLKLYLCLDAIQVQLVRL
ncbi:hypothetical protein Micbo1qcDRAFT_174593 [Microdochium bolleyi]|uniref:Uncharacterized protein n=1 Tax=Microdochium bolleyi TaxID=196109 RepID=A0A136J8Q9_9PEZI|nr:hypothetical protein Micbo1qcDRAFT_174593 [Microdochium bolleyi]